MSKTKERGESAVANVLSPADLDLLRQLRVDRVNREPVLPHIPRTFGARFADGVAAVVGSWRFIIIQSILLVIWIILNVIAWQYRWDPYPFILLNLALSFQAAYTAPIIMMSQNRQSEIDRRNQQNDYEINQKAELEIELLHQKIDLLRSQEIERLIHIIEELAQRLPAAERI